MTPLEAALRYISRGWRVVPLHIPTGKQDRPCSCNRPGCDSIGKHPRTLRGVLDATTETAIIERWFRDQWPDSNIGIATGDSFFVIDIDVRHDGLASLSRLQSENGPLPATVRQTTGGGGAHLLFKLPDFEVRNRAAVLPGLDVRGANGFIVAPPSRHASGAEYRWAERCGPAQIEIADAPAWLLALIREKVGGGEARPRGAWLPMFANGIENGRRDDTLTKMAGHFFRRFCDPDLTTAALLGINQVYCRPPLETPDVFRIAKSISEKELRRRALEGST